MCKSDSLEAIPEAERSEMTTWLDFGKEIKLSEFSDIGSSQEFCEGMGFEVREEPFCFNGVPTAEILKLNQVKRGWKNKKNQATVDRTFS